MKKWKSLLVFLLITSTFLSCETNDNLLCISGDVRFTSLEAEFGCMNTPAQVDIDLSETYMIIRDQSTYNILVSGCDNSIDFDAYDLIIGKKFLTSGLQSIGYEVSQDCNNNRVTISVEITKDDTTIAPNITYHVLIPKLASNQNLVVDVSILN